MATWNHLVKFAITKPRKANSEHWPWLQVAVFGIHQANRYGFQQPSNNAVISGGCCTISMGHYFGYLSLLTKYGIPNLIGSFSYSASKSGISVTFCVKWHAELNRVRVQFSAFWNARRKVHSTWTHPHCDRSYPAPCNVCLTFGIFFIREPIMLEIRDIEWLPPDAVWWVSWRYKSHCPSPQIASLSSISKRLVQQAMQFVFSLLRRQDAGGWPSFQAVKGHSWKAVKSSGRSTILVRDTAAPKLACWILKDERLLLDWCLNCTYLTIPSRTISCHWKVSELRPSSSQRSTNLGHIKTMVERISIHEPEAGTVFSVILSLISIGALSVCLCMFPAC